MRGPPGLLARLPSHLWCAAGPPAPPPVGVVAVGPCSAAPRSLLRPVASYLGPVPGSLVGPGRPSASPAGVPPGSTARPPAASFLRPRGAALCVPAPAGPPSLRCGLPVVALPPLLRAVRRRARSPGPPLRRPLRAVLAAVQMGVGSVGLLRPGALAGPRSPRWGGRGPVCVALRPGAFALRRCSAARRLRWGPRWCCVLLLGLLPVGGFSPSPSPLPLPRWGRGRAPGPSGWQAPQRGPLFADPSGPPLAPPGVARWGCASPVDFPKIVNRPAAHDCERAVKGK